eukprot:4165258-Amphidinium_carterae.1
MKLAQVAMGWAYHMDFHRAECFPSALRMLKDTHFRSVRISCSHKRHRLTAGTWSPCVPCNFGATFSGAIGSLQHLCPLDSFQFRLPNSQDTSYSKLSAVKLVMSLGMSQLLCGLRQLDSQIDATP